MSPLDHIITALDNANQAAISRQELYILAVIVKTRLQRRQAGEEPPYIMEIAKLLRGIDDQGARQLMKRVRKKGLIKSRTAWHNGRLATQVWPTKAGLEIFSARERATV